MGNSKTANRALVVAILLNLACGFQYCWSLLGQSIISEYGWTATQAALPYTVLTIVTSVWAIFAGRLGEYVAPKATIAFGGLCMGLGLIISSRTTSPVIMVLSVGGFLGLASTSITSNTSPNAMKWFPASKKGLIVGAVTMGMGLSSLYMAPVINSLLAGVGLSNTFLYMGIAAIIIICGLAILFPTPPSTQELIDRRKAERQGKVIQKSAEEMEEEKTAARKMEEEDAGTIYQNKVMPNMALRTKEFWALFFIYIACWMPGQMITSSVANICRVQANWQDGFIAVMAMAIGNGAGRLCSAGLSDRLGVVKTYRMLFAVQAVNLLLFSIYRSPVLMFIGVVILGFCVGSGVPLQIALTAQVYGRKFLGSISGMIQPAFGIAGFVGPVLAGRILDTTGSYHLSYLFNAVVMVVGIGLTFIIREKKSIAK